MFSDPHKTPKYTVCGQNVELYFVKNGATYSVHWALKVYFWYPILPKEKLYRQSPTFIHSPFSKTCTKVEMYESRATGLHITTVVPFPLLKNI